MTVQFLKESLEKGEKILFIDVREQSEAQRLTIGGNRLNYNELQSKIATIKALHTEGGYYVVVGCKFFESGRVPKHLALLRQNDIACEALTGSRTTGGGILAAAFAYGKNFRVPTLNI